MDFYGLTPHDPSDFLWLMTEEPHRSRRMAILKAHPEVSNNSPSASLSLVSRRNSGTLAQVPSADYSQPICT
jgi:Sphingolipid Delta4-desaturase (DES)